MTAPPRSIRSDYLARPDHEQRADRDQRATVALPVAEEEQRFSLSATQIMASMAAAVTAATVGSKLGVAGTVVGAGLASVISVVGGAVFGHSILLTRKQVRRAVMQVRGADQEPAGGQPAAERVSAADDLTVVIPAAGVTDLARPVTESARTVTDLARTGPERGDPRRPRPTRRRLGAGLLVGVAAAGAIFAGSLAAVTLVETVKGSPLSGGDSGGLSVLGGSAGTDSTSTVEVPATTTELSTVTHTVTSETTSAAPSTSAPTTASSSAPATSQATTSSPPAQSSSAPSSTAASAPPVDPAGGSAAATTTPAGSASDTAVLGK